MPRKQLKTGREAPGRVERLGFRLDEATKHLIERAAHLSRRKVSDFCVTALTDSKSSMPSSSVLHSTHRPTTLRSPKRRTSRSIC